MGKLEPNTLKSLIMYLMEHGYPESSLSIEYPIGKYRVDLAIVDPDIKEPVAIFEVKSRRTQQSEKYGKTQIKSYLKALKKTSVPAYLVFGSDGTPPIEIQRISFEDEVVQNIDRKFSAESIPDFTTLIKSKRNVKIAETTNERKEIIDLFFIVCWICGTVIAILLLSKVQLSGSDLILLGGVIGLILLPFASKFKFLGLEFERLAKEDKSNKRD